MTKLLQTPIWSLAVWILAFLMLSQTARAAQDDGPPAAALNLFREAAVLQNEGEFDLAAEVWDSFVKRYPDLELTDRAQHYRGVCYLKTGDLPKAIESFDIVVKNSNEESPFPMLEDALLNLGWCRFSLAQQGQDTDENYPLAAATLNRLLTEFPDGKYEDQALYFLAEALYLNGNAPDSITPYKGLVDDHKESSLRSNAMYALGVAYEDTDQPTEASQVYTAFLAEYAEHPFRLEVSMRLAEILLQEGLALEGDGDSAAGLAKIASAEASFSELAANEDYDQRDLALFKQAFCVYKRGDLLESAKLYASVAENYPDSTNARSSALSAGRFFYRSNELTDAMKWLEAVGAGEDQESIEAAHWMCRIHLKQDNPQLAYLVANGMLNKSLPESEFLILLMLDRADAAYEIPDRKDSALQLYVAVAESAPNNPQAAQGWYYASFAAFEAEDYEKAIELSANYLERFSDESLALDVLSVRGESELQLAQYEDAETTFRRLNENGQGRAELESWNLRLGLSLYLQNKSSETIEWLESKLASFELPSSKAEAYHLIGATHFRDQQFDSASTALQAALSAKPDWRQADESNMLLARSQFRLGEVDAAITSINSLLANFPDSGRKTEAQYRLGEFLFSAEKYDDALAAYDLALASDDAAYQPYALDGKAWAHFKQNNFEQAAQNFGALIEGFADHDLAKQAKYGRAVSRNQIEQFAGAQSDIEAYLSEELSDSQKANGWYELGVAQVGLNDLDSAITSFQRILDDHPSFDRTDSVLYELGWCHIDQGMTAKAAPMFKRIVSEFPKSSKIAEAYFFVGEASYIEKEYEAALGMYAKCVENAGELGIGENACYKLGWSNFHLEKFAEALEAFEQQVQKYPEGSLILDGEFMTAESLYRLNDFAKALPQYKRVWPLIENKEDVGDAVKASTLLHGSQSAGQVKEWDIAEQFGMMFVENYDEAAEVPEAWLQIGRGQRGQGKLDEAIESLEKAAVLGADEIGAHARFLVGEIHFGRQEYGEAQKQFRRVILGYGGDNASAEVKVYQASSAYEAARCSEVQIKDAEGDARSQLIADAKKYYQDVVNKFADSPYATRAEERLVALNQL